MISYEGRNRYTVNFLKTLTFDRPEWTICDVSSGDTIPISV